ncbi:MAG: M23 family metallopeptidase [Chloroflexi bacterium]|nr:M23 family metallopeptidase [Chloroflexota bacterium]
MNRRRVSISLVVALMVLGLFAAGMAVHRRAHPVPPPTQTPPRPTATPEHPPSTRVPAVQAYAPGSRARWALPSSDHGQGTVPVAPLAALSYGLPPLPRVITYTVRPGDTLSTIAQRFGLTLDSLRWSNPDIAYNPDDLYPGQVLRIPPINGAVVEVREGDTVESLARRFHVPPEVIRTYAANRLKPPYTLKPGTLLIIPGGSLEVDLPPPRPYPGYTYMWPVRGVITQRYHAYHHGLDIGTVYGAGVYAARSGRVRTVRWDDSGYGYMVIIDHGDGWSTLYAHLKGALVQPGQWVSRGALIGRVGGTGRATGPHIHFEIRKGRVRYNPEKFLPPTP